ncbi:hypothetical protein DYB26_010155 [Aphanomyces astaci]|uniref:DUF6818 domain-containing protein n=2 Tax=Aphanomyces astaci TaxID=112090 RepID=A0A397FFZ8_APHAT|nr:hypothetical protein DYB34_012295 [Aphanomyces astaci]RHY84965.1 hypothetical protein DYB26_010155 [Aphanomyces astaci]RHZ31548.1 hypothetical protein DYB31_011374 [Aphanomyces astaci]
MAKKAKGRGKSWCPGSVELMLDHIHELMPAGSNVWDEVAAKFNAGPYPFRDAEGIKRKFYTLRNNAEPTGDPSCPVDVVRTKFISRRVDANCAVLTMEDDEDDMDDDGHGDGNSDGNNSASEQGIPMLCNSVIHVPLL